MKPYILYFLNNLLILYVFYILGENSPISYTISYISMQSEEIQILLTVTELTSFIINGCNLQTGLPVFLITFKVLIISLQNLHHGN